MLELVYWAALAVGTYAAFIYFRDLGDITQVLLNVSRENMLNAIRNENRLVATGLVGTALGVLLLLWIPLLILVRHAAIRLFPDHGP